VIFDAHASLGQSLYGPRQTPDELLAAMDRHGIERAVVSAFTPPDLDLRRANAELARVAAAHDRLVGFARIDPRLGARALDELRRCRDEGLRGVKVDPFQQAFRITSELVFPFFAACAEARLLVLVETGHPTVSSPIEVGDVARRLPALRVLLAHGGQLAMHGLGILDCLLVVKEVPNVFVETSAIPETGTESLIEQIVLTVAADRVVFGTNSPINHPEMELERVRVAAVPEAARKQILGPNLARLLEA
jgi:predicted TIM-barrel fold metal-dependent hydrolase